MKALFAAAADLPAADRAEFLARGCGGDADLRRRVEHLLAAHDAPASVLDRPLAAPPEADATTRGYDPADQTVERPAPATAAVGDRVGPYKLLERIGEGGMGEVWVADQAEPIKRRVAVKLIKPGMDSRGVLGRFEAERQALAVMDHPNIARVLDAGTAADGRPYFVMELVKGTPITAFADARRLTPTQRLELFVPVCQAIQHAHLKGIIHRDIKPSNVLVALHDEAPVPKVIDFGVAKAVGQPLTERTVYTGFGALVGTPAYMAPEQAAFNQLDVDTRADVYALGVLLYELLAGSPPIETARLKRAALDEVLRLVRDEEPPRPSQRLSTSEACASIAATRGSEPAKLSALMKGELDWIVMKALEKDRARRYETATGFAADVQRYLAGEPVLAVPPSLGYRLAKAYRKNQAAVWVASAFALLMVVGVTVSSLQAVRANEAERVASAERDVAVRAEAAARESERQATEERNRAMSSGAEAKAFSDFLVNRFLAAGRPTGQDGGLGVDVRMSKALLSAESALAKDFRDQPAAEAVARHAIGLTYYYLGQPLLAATHLRKARELHTAARGPDDPKTLEMTHDLALALGNMRLLGEAAELLAGVVDKQAARVGAAHADTLSARMNLAEMYRRLGRVEEAIRLQTETLAGIRAALGPDHKLAMFSAAMLARAYLDQGGGAVAQAAPLLEDAVERARAVFTADHPTTLFFQQELAAAYLKGGRPAAAVTVLEDALSRSRKLRGNDQHPANLGMRESLLEALFVAGRPEDGIRLVSEEYQETLAITKNHDALPSQLVLRKLRLLCDQSDYPQGVVEVYRPILADLRKHLPAGHMGFASWLDIIGYYLLKQEKWEEAGEVLGECRAIRDKQRPGQWGTFVTHTLLGAALLGQKKYAEGEQLLVEGYEGMAREQKLNPAFGNLAGPLPNFRSRCPEAVDRIIELYTATDKPEEVKKWEAERQKYKTLTPPPEAKK